MSLQAAQEAQGRAVAAVGALLTRGVRLSSNQSNSSHHRMERTAELMSQWSIGTPDTTASQDILIEQLEAFKQNNAPAASIRAAAYESAFKEHAQV